MPSKLTQQAWHEHRSKLSRGVWSAADAAATPLASLITTAGLVRALGAQDYGILIIVLAVSALSLSISPAIGAATTKFIAEAASVRGHRDDSSPRIIGSSLLVVFGVSVLLLLVVIAALNPITQLLFGSLPTFAIAVVQRLLILAVITICLQQLDAVFAAALRGLERFREQAILELAIRSMVAGAMVAVGVLTKNLADILLANCACLTVAIFARGFAYKRLTPSARLLDFPDKEQARRFLSFGTWMWLSATATAAYGTVDRLIVGRTMGPGAVAQFQIYLQLSQLVHFIPSSIAAFAFPAFSRLSRQTGASEAIRRAYLKLTAFIVGGAAVIAGTLLQFRQTLWAFIAGSTLHVADPLPFYALVGGFFIMSFNVAPYYLLLGLGHSKKISLITSGSVLASITAAALLIPANGLTGAAVARFAYVAGTLSLVKVANTAIWNRK